MKKLLLGAVVGLALVALGYTTSLRALWQRTADWAEQQKSAEQMAAEIDVHLKDMDERIVLHEVKLLKAARQAKAIEEDVTRFAGERDRKVAALKRARELLSEERGDYVIAGRSWSGAEVEADVRVRIKELKTLEQQLAVAGARLKGLRDAVSQGRKVLADSRAQRSAKAAELAALRVRLTNARQLAEVQEITRALADTGLTQGDTSFRKTWEALLDRVNAAEVALDSPARNPGAIPYEEPPRTRDTLAEIDAALKGASDR
jgi:chromosome segregation ATPase